MIDVRKELEIERAAMQKNRAIFQKLQTNLLYVVEQLKPNHSVQVEFVKWEQFESIPVGHKIFVGESYFEKVYSSDPDVMKWTCTITENEKLSLQAHDFVEKIRVIEGKFIDYVTDKVYHQGQTAVFDIKQEHQPGSDIGTKLVVTMHRDIINVTPQG